MRLNYRVAHVRAIAAAFSFFDIASRLSLFIHSFTCHWLDLVCSTITHRVVLLCRVYCKEKKKEKKEKNKIPLDLLILSIRFCVPYSAVGASIDSFLFLKERVSSLFSVFYSFLYPTVDSTPLHSTSFVRLLYYYYGSLDVALVSSSFCFIFFSFLPWRHGRGGEGG
jgi:hypothetical protein